MLRFILQRLLSLIPLLLGVTLLASVLMYLSPGDVLTSMRANPEIPSELVTELEQRYGLTDSEGKPSPWYVRYASWLSRVVQGDLGESITYRIPVGELIGQRALATALLSFSSLAFAWLIAVPLGVLAALKKDSVFDRLSAWLAYAALSIPEFFLAILAVFLASVTGLFPVGGGSSFGSEFMPPASQFADYVWHLILPTVVLGIGGVASLMRIMRANFLDYIRLSFVSTARAKGLPEYRIMFTHVLRNAINPLITSLGLSLSGIFSGSLLVENVMSYPGLGQLVYQALLEEDEFVVMASLMVSVGMLVAGNLLADIGLAWSDPRIRSHAEGSATASERGVSAKGIRMALGIPCALVLVSIALQEFFPQVLPMCLEGLRMLALSAGAVLLLSCVALIGYTIYVMIRRVLPLAARHPLGPLAMGVLGCLYGLMMFADVIAPHPMDSQNLRKAFHPPTELVIGPSGLEVQGYRLSDPSTRTYTPVKGQFYAIEWFPRTQEPVHVLGFIPVPFKLAGLKSDSPDACFYPLGCDSLGRCLFSRLLYGSQISLTIGLIGISITLTLGFIVGGLSGYFGGVGDFIAMRWVELLMSIPSLYLLLSLRSALLQPGLSSSQVYAVIVVILSLIGWAGAARVIRGMSLSIRKRAFVQAAESMGVGTLGILLRHLLPNLATFLLVTATLSIPGYILGEAALSFLGLGITEPSTSWGLMLRQAQSDMKAFFLGWWWLLTPGVAMAITVIAFNLLGDVLRDVLDPRLDKRARQP